MQLSVIYLIIIILEICFMRLNKIEITFQFGDSQIIKKIKQNIEELNSLCNFRPLIILSNGHISTMFNTVKYNKNKYERKYLFMKDGGRVAIDILDVKNSNLPTILLLPGIGGNYRSSYIQSATSLLHENNYRVIVHNFRGCSYKITTDRTYSYGNTEDTEEIIRWIIKKYSGKIIGCGFSVGANIITKYMGTTNEDIKSDLFHSLCGAITVGNGYFINWGYEIVEKSFLDIYNNIFLNKIKKAWNNKLGYDIKTVYEFDNKITRKIYGYDTMYDFIRIESCGNYLKNITKPVIFINSLDDPVLPKHVEKFCQYIAKKNNNLLFMYTNYGGHLSFRKDLFSIDSVIDDVILTCCNSIKLFNIL